MEPCRAGTVQQCANAEQLDGLLEWASVRSRRIQGALQAIERKGDDQLHAGGIDRLTALPSIRKVRARQLLDHVSLDGGSLVNVQLPPSTTRPRGWEGAFSALVSVPLPSCDSVPWSCYGYLGGYLKETWITFRICDPLTTAAAVSGAPGLKQHAAPADSDIAMRSACATVRWRLE